MAALALFRPNQLVGARATPDLDEAGRKVYDKWTGEQENFLIDLWAEYDNGQLESAQSRKYWVMIISHFTLKTQMSFKNACVCDANADQKLSRYCRNHITRRNILATTNKIVVSADRPSDRPNNLFLEVSKCRII